MQRYTVQRQLGDGAYGRVVCARDNETGELVAIKGIKKRIERWNDALGLREVKALTTIKKHPNIVRLKQLIHENQMVYFVFEYCESNLFEVCTR
jgi:serine/threonine protein kinase